MFRHNKEALGQATQAVPGLDIKSVSTPSGVATIVGTSLNPLNIPVTSSPIITGAAVALAPLTLGVSALIGDLFGGGLGFDWGGAESNAAGVQTQQALQAMGQSIQDLIQSKIDEIKAIVDAYNALPQLQEGVDFLTDAHIKDLQFRLVQMYDLYITSMKQELLQTFTEIKEQIRQAIQIEWSGVSHVSTN